MAGETGPINVSVRPIMLQCVGNYRFDIYHFQTPQRSVLLEHGDRYIGNHSPRHFGIPSLLRTRP
jgi:hypothetical protein